LQLLQAQLATAAVVILQQQMALGPAHLRVNDTTFLVAENLVGRFRDVQQPHKHHILFG